MVTIEIISNNLIIYGIVFLMSSYALFKWDMQFKDGGLLDYFIYLTSKVLLFFISLSTLFIFCVLMVTPSYNVYGFLQELINNMLIYAFINYGMCYFMKFWLWLRDFTEKNDLYNTKLLKEVGETKK